MSRNTLGLSEEELRELDGYSEVPSAPVVPNIVPAASTAVVALASPLTPEEAIALLPVERRDRLDIPYCHTQLRPTTGAIDPEKLKMKLPGDSAPQPTRWGTPTPAACRAAALQQQPIQPIVAQPNPQAFFVKPKSYAELALVAEEKDRLAQNMRAPKHIDPLADLQAPEPAKTAKRDDELSDDDGVFTSSLRNA